MVQCEQLYNVDVKTIEHKTTDYSLIYNINQFNSLIVI